MAHVFVRVSGFGAVVLPVRAPFRVLAPEEAHPALQLSVGTGEEARGAYVRFRDDAVDLSLAPGTGEVGEVATFQRGPDLDHWRLDTVLFSVRWPRGLALASPGPEVSSPFDLYGPEGALVFVQGPYPAGQVPAPAALRAPGQVLLRTGITNGHAWAEFGYETGEQRWVQRQCPLALSDGRVLLLSSQAQEAHSEAIGAAVDELVGSFVAR